ncbi:hypothetical protein RclHR1_33020001 [Rhizophagus clarus]|nr:hypothetical protein RclHR1_33020001 [Rhizophagus clarus]
MSEDSVKVSRKIIEKLLRYDSQIISKIDILINGQKDIKNCLKDIEKKLGRNNNKTNNTIDQNYIKLTKQHNNIRGTYTSRQKLENKEKFLCFETKNESSSTDTNNRKLGKGANDNKGTNTNSKNADKGEGINTNCKGEGTNTDSKDNKGASIDNKGESIYDSDGSYNTEKENQHLNSLFDNYKLRRR